MRSVRLSAETFTFQLGDFKCISISDGIQPIDADTLPTFFAGADESQLARALEKHEISLLIISNCSAAAC